MGKKREKHAKLIVKDLINRVILLTGHFMDFSGSVVNLFHVCEFNSFKVFEGMIGTKFFCFYRLSINLGFLFEGFLFLPFLAFVMAVEFFEI